MDRFRARVRVRDVEVEVEAADKDYVEAKLKELLATFGGTTALTVGALGKPAAAPIPGPKKGSTGTKPMSMVEYVRSLAPKSGPQYVIAVGDYLERHGGMAGGFRTRDVIEGFRMVKYKHTNPAEAVRSAKQQGLLMDGKEAGAMIVTQTGESWIKGQLSGLGEEA